MGRGGRGRGAPCMFLFVFSIHFLFQTSSFSFRPTAYNVQRFKSTSRHPATSPPQTPPLVHYVHASGPQYNVHRLIALPVILNATNFSFDPPTLTFGVWNPHQS